MICKTRTFIAIPCIVLYCVLNGSNIQANQARQVEEELKGILSLANGSYPHLKNLTIVDMAFPGESLKPSIETNCLELKSEKILCRIFLTDTLRKSLTPDEFYAVLAHEVGHIANKDYKRLDPNNRFTEIEKEADRFAISILRQAHKNPNILVDALNSLKKFETAGSSKREIEQRIRTIQQLIDKK